MLTISNISKSFGSVKALDNIDLKIDSGEFFALLGPSGCGKTTLLRIISGFEKPDNGDVLLNKENITHIKPYNRPTNLLFQSYALFPHLTVFKNIAYGLERENLSKEEIKERVDSIIARTSLDGLNNRKPDELSGGQKQRVALARCLIKKPKILLLDEPLSALDKNLKEQMKIELKKIQNDFNITFIMVTHDQDEALVLADKIAVMNHGKIIQIDKPEVLYSNPKNYFVANFIGKMNFFEINRSGNQINFLNGKCLNIKTINREVGKNLIGIRPEDIYLFKSSEELDFEFSAEVTHVGYHGKEVELIVKSDLSSSEIYIKANKSFKNIKKYSKIACFCNTNLFKIY
jgi:ABC-type Fe3+/spermidine/putrescine transport system ATPase subunit|tara:strand:+ start:8366 stop:9403 length:1038 start_codon:yes stop_codon:yes gene_type:complete